MDIIDISDQLNRESSSNKFKGKIITGIEFQVFMKKTIGEKFKFIRDTMNKTYRNEYRKNVTDKAGVLTYLGLKKIEEGNKPRRDTVELLAKFYDIPMYVFYPEEYPPVKGIFIAKKKDKDEYFKAYWFEHFSLHPLDPSNNQEPFTDDDFNAELAKQYGIDDDGFPWVDDEEGEGRRIDTLSIHLNVGLFCNIGNFLVLDKNLRLDAKLSFNDIKHLEKMIRREIRYLSSKNETHIRGLEETDDLLFSFTDDE